MIKLTTNHGVITLNLDAEKAPKTVANFIAYVEAGHYNNTVFHRVIKNFMIQGGGMEPGMKQKECKAPIENEAANGLKNKRGTVAMARTNDPHSATAQFSSIPLTTTSSTSRHRAARVGVTACLAKLPKAWMSSTRFAPSRPAPKVSIRTYRLKM
jgi:cyclophilin family peptidyl-prolyl cis-trans isomerase